MTDATSETTAMMIDEAGIGAAVLERVSSDGAAIVPLATAWSTTTDALRESSTASPFAFAARLLGVDPLMVERQPIRPALGGRSYASTRVDTPLHTDSQMFLGMPASIQVLVCVEPASRGGESVLVDGARVLARLEREDPALANALFDVERVQRFYFGDVPGPTVARRGGHLTWTVAPVAPGQLAAADELGRRLASAIAREQRMEHTLRAGEALVASNHRMLHGRRPFEGNRELIRLLVWLERPLACDPRHLSRARELSPPLPAPTLARVRSVLAILRGVPPAKVAAEARVSEATLYAWRDAFMRASAAALS